MVGRRKRTSLSKISKSLARKQKAIVEPSRVHCLCCNQTFSRLPKEHVCDTCRTTYGKSLPRILAAKNVQYESTRTCHLCSRPVFRGNKCDLHAQLSEPGTVVIDAWVKKPPKRKRRDSLREVIAPDTIRCKCGNVGAKRDGKCKNCRKKRDWFCRCGSNNRQGKDFQCIECRSRCECGKKREGPKARCATCRKSKPIVRQKATQRSQLPAHVVAAYSARNSIIRGMGFETYAKYIESALWKTIRSRALKKDSHRCCKCHRNADQVHHSQYTFDNLKGTSLDGLHAVCGKCHNSAEVGSNGRKLSLKEANERLGISGGVPRQPVATVGRIRTGDGRTIDLNPIQSGSLENSPNPPAATAVLGDHCHDRA